MEKNYEQITEAAQNVVEQIAQELEKVVGIDQTQLHQYIETVAGMRPKEIDALLKRLKSRLGEKLLPLLEEMTRHANEALAEIGVNGLGTIPSFKAAQILAEINDAHPVKNLRKAARKSLHKLKTVGIEIETTLKPLLGEIKHQRYKAMISPVDGTGTQLVLLTQEMLAGDLHFLQVVAGDEDGIAECTSKRGMTKKMFAKLPETFAMQIGAKEPMLAEAEYDFAMSLLLEAEQATADSLPEEYENGKGFFELSQAQIITNPVYQTLDAETLKQQPGLLRTSAELFQNDHFLSWHLPLNELGDYAQELMDQEDSTIEVSPEVRQERKEDVYQKLIDAKMDDVMIQRLKRRLEIMAYLFTRQGKDEDAKKALIAAISLGETPRTELKSHPFVRELLIISLDGTRDVLEGGYNPEELDRKEYYLTRDDDGNIRVEFVEQADQHDHDHHDHQHAHHDHDHQDHGGRNYRGHDRRGPDHHHREAP